MRIIGAERRSHERGERDTEVNREGRQPDGWGLLDEYIAVV